MLPHFSRNLTAFGQHLLTAAVKKKEMRQFNLRQE